MYGRCLHQFVCVVLFFVTSTACREAGHSVADDKARAKADSIEAALIEYYEQGFRKEADSLADVAFSPEDKQSRYALKKYYGLKGLFRVKERRYEDALKYSTRYIAIIDTTNSAERHEYVMQLTSHGSIYYNLQNYNAAYRYYHKARSLTPDNKCFVGYFDYSIAMALYKQEDYESSLRAFLDAYQGYLTCDKQFERELRKQEILSNTGLCYWHLHKYDSALYYYKLADRQIDSIPEVEASHSKWKEIAHAVVDGNRSRVYLDMHNTDSALYYVRRDIAVNLQPSYDLNQGAGSLLHLGEIYFAEQSWKALDSTLRVARKYIDQLNRSALLLEWYNLKRKHAYARGQWDSAAQYGDRYILLQDSLTQRDKEAFNSDVQLALQSMDSEHQLNLLRQENEYTARSYNYLLGILLLAVVLVMASFAFLFFIRRKNRQLAKKTAELEFSNLELQQLNTEKDRILGIVAHDLRTPVAGIISMVKMLKENELSTSEYRELLELIDTSGKSSLELINEIMLLTDLKSEHAAREKISVNDLLTMTTNLIKFKAQEKNQTLDLKLLQDDVYIEADANKLRRALSNIITNAVKFSREGSVISVGAELVNDRVKFSINDQGIGIPSFMKKDLFESFTKAKRLGTNGEKPFGLGLSIVKQIVEKHSGKVWFDSEEGQGSTFFIELPVR